MSRNENGFLDVLARFEKCLETPIVSGELPAWLLSAQTACKEVGVALCQEINQQHGPMLKEIAEQDMELATHINDMKQQDDELLAHWNDIQFELDSLHGAAEHAEPHEAKLDSSIESLTEKALHFVIEARKQETALTTWYLEAFNRDRGIAD